MTSANKLLKRCPCGSDPVKLCIIDAGQGGKYAYATGPCCNEWHVEFRTDYENLESDKCMELAIKAWNSSPRGFNIFSWGGWGNR